MTLIVVGVYLPGALLHRGGAEREAEARRLMRRAAAVAARNAYPMAAAYQGTLAARGWDQTPTAEELAEYDRLLREDEEACPAPPPAKGAKGADDAP